jgi:hypothetical protein
LIDGGALGYPEEPADGAGEGSFRRFRRARVYGRLGGSFQAGLLFIFGFLGLGCPICVSGVFGTDFLSDFNFFPNSDGESTRGYRKKNEAEGKLLETLNLVLVYYPNVVCPGVLS